MIDKILGDYQLFFSDLCKELAKIPIDIHDMKVSHICYRVTTMEEYIEARDGLLKYSQMYVENEFNGRPISMLLLREPLELRKGFLAPMIELPAPKTSHTYLKDLEHLGLVVKEDFSDFKKSYNHVLHGQKDRGNHCQPLFLTFNSGKTVKFYEIPLKDVVSLEGWEFKKVKSD